MKQRFLNLVALAIIGMGSGYLVAHPAAAQAATTTAECEEGEIIVEGDKCYVNDEGHCECVDVE